MFKVRRGLIAVAVAVVAVVGLVPGVAHAVDYGPAAQITLTNDDGRLEQFRTLANGHRIEHQWRNDNGTWSGWKSFGGSFWHGTLNGYINADGRLEIFAVDYSTNSVLHMWQNKPNGVDGWSSWWSLGGTVKQNNGVWVTPLSQGRIQIKVLGVDNLWHTKYQQSPSCCWTPNWL